MTKTDFHPHEQGCRFGFDVEMLSWSCHVDYLLVYENQLERYLQQKCEGE